MSGYCAIPGQKTKARCHPPALETRGVLLAAHLLLRGWGGRLQGLSPERLQSTFTSVGHRVLKYRIFLKQRVIFVGTLFVKGIRGVIRICRKGHSDTRRSETRRTDTLPAAGTPPYPRTDPAAAGKDSRSRGRGRAAPRRGGGHDVAPLLSLLPGPGPPRHRQGAPPFPFPVPPALTCAAAAAAALPARPGQAPPTRWPRPNCGPAYDHAPVAVPLRPRPRPSRWPRLRPRPCRGPAPVTAPPNRRSRPLRAPPTSPPRRRSGTDRKAPRSERRPSTGWQSAVSHARVTLGRARCAAEPLR